MKLAFNLANFMFVAAAAMTIFYGARRSRSRPRAARLDRGLRRDGRGAVLSALTVATAISMSGGAPQFQKLLEMVQFGGLVAVANTSLALLAVAILWVKPALLTLLVVPLGVVFLAYRAYVVGAREAPAARAALPVEPDPAALPGARLRPRRPAGARPRDVPRRARRARPVAPRRQRRRPAHDGQPRRRRRRWCRSRSPP